MSAPTPFQQHVHDATRAFANGDAATADRLAGAALKLQRDDPNALYVRALARRALGRTDEAIKALRSALKSVPRSAEVVNVLGLCEQDRGAEDAARLAFETAEGFDPGFVHAPFNLARLLFDMGERREAAAAYERALAIDPNHADALRGLAHALNVLREFDRAEVIAERTLALAPADAVALSVKAGALLRAGDADGAVTLIRARLKPREGGAMNVALALGVLGEAHEARGEYADAFQAWGFANERIRAEVEARYEASQAPYSLAVIQRLAAAVANPSAPQDGDSPAPVFLVGFPRSGTTLLENILAAHPAIITSEERPHAEGIVTAAGATPDSLAALLQTGGKRLEALRRDYWQRARPGEGPPQAGTVFIDKLPLNLPWMGVIAHVFPSARFILALRDPRDCVLSAFQQRFVLNPAMFRMLRIDDAARYYDAAFSAAEAARTANPGLSVHEVRYEDIVSDFEGEARRVLDFLGLDWDPGVLAYREQAQKRDINTPSAPQVDQPLHGKAIGRWRNFAPAFEGEPDRLLSRWVARWGYDASS